MHNQSTSDFSQHAVIDRFDGMNAVVKVEGGQEVCWPVKLLPDDAKVGMTVRLVLSTSASDEAERSRVARAMLNDLLRAPK